MDTIDLLKWSTLTSTINEIKSPNSFIKNLLFTDHEPVETEDIELSVLVGDREMAPFVSVNGEAIMVAGMNEKFMTVKAPNIRIKRPLEAYKLLTQRAAGTSIFPGSGAIAAAARAKIGRQLQKMADMITNSEEYLCCMALQGTISYSVADEASFQITYPKAAGNTVVLGAAARWSASTSTPETDIHEAKRVLSDAVGLQPTDAIMGSGATAAFMTNAAIRALLDTKNVNLGSLDFTTQFQADGAIYLGTISGVRFWSYPRTIKVAGVTTNLIRTEYVEFVCRTPAADFKLYYGAIPDVDAFDGGLWVGERFAKTWKQPDPSAMMLLSHARPLPCPRRVDSIYSLKVIA